MKVGSRVSQEIQAAMTSTEDGAVEPDEIAAKLDFSQDLFEISTPRKKRVGASPRIKKSPVSRSASQSPAPPLTYKRKAKPTPEKKAASSEGSATTSNAAAVFDFPE
ncbi:hypothetical protein PINS_up005544 [Pythium insidiosum]|nr:hypothetical protein PINS_up005544 [Pythium insidiosum]